MNSRLFGFTRVSSVFGKRYPTSSLRSNQLPLSDLVPSDVEMSFRGGAGYRRRGRGPNRGGGRGRGDGSGRGRDSREGGGGDERLGAPPPGLRGRALGMWYAGHSRARKKARERNEVGTQR